MGTPIDGKSHTSPLMGTEKVPLSPDGYATTDEIAALGTGGGGGWIYGDGSGGDLVLHDGDTWVPGNYGNVTIEEGATITLATAASAWPIFRCTGTFTINGTLNLSGQDAADRTGGSHRLASRGLSMGSGKTATTGPGSFAAAFNLTDLAPLINANGTPDGGAGGDGAAGSGGQPFSLLNYPTSKGPRSGAGLMAETIINCPVGDASGAGDDTNYGGGGGGAGDWAVIVARHVVHGVDNIYNLQGGNGGPGGDDGTGAPNTGNGDCGGGGGGAGGYWVTISDTVDAQPAVIVGTGGAGGAGCGTGTDGSPGDDGFVVHLLNN